MVKNPSPERANTCSRPLGRPFRARKPTKPFFPGRCPGLSKVAPLGLGNRPNYFPRTLLWAVEGRPVGARKPTKLFFPRRRPGLSKAAPLGLGNRPNHFSQDVALGCRRSPRWGSRSFHAHAKSSAAVRSSGSARGANRSIKEATTTPGPPARSAIQKQKGPHLDITKAKGATP